MNLTTIPVNVPGICIPRVFSNIDANRVEAIFKELGLGEIDRIVIQQNKSSKEHHKTNHIFVHLKAWSKTTTANEVRQRLLTGDEVKIIYDEPWFWKISAIRDMKPFQTQETTPSGKNGSRQQSIPSPKPKLNHALHSESRTRRGADEFSRYNRRRNFQAIPTVISHNVSDDECEHADA
jgi:hypothetical protein